MVQTVEDDGARNVFRCWKSRPVCFGLMGASSTKRRIIEQKVLKKLIELMSCQSLEQAGQGHGLAIGFAIGFVVYGAPRAVQSLQGAQGNSKESFFLIEPHRTPCIGAADLPLLLLLLLVCCAAGLWMFELGFVRSISVGVRPQHHEPQHGEWSGLYRGRQAVYGFCAHRSRAVSALYRQRCLRTSV